MSNFNDKIPEYTGDGIPAYNRKINEIIKKLNWLMGMRSINGKPITESDQGPVFDLSPVSTSQGAQPWQTDPLGNQAGWSKIKVFDPTGLMFFDLYAWTGALLAKEDAPWLFDPSNNQAGWIICPQNSFWGTGQCAAGTSCLNFRNGVATSSSGPSTTSPFWTIWQPSGAPITPPANCTPRFYLTAGDLNAMQGLTPVPSQPAYWMTALTIEQGQPVPGGQLSFTYTIAYDGNQFFTLSGNAQVPSNVSVTLYFPVNPAGWVYDPSGIPGYSQGSGSWLYLFNGPASPNTNPPLLHTVTWSFPAVADGHGGFFGNVFMTG